MILLTSTPQEDINLIARQYVEFDYTRANVVGVVDVSADKLMAIVAYYNYIPECSIEIAWAKIHDGHYVTKRVLREVFEYPFNFLKVRRVTIHANKKNKAVLDYCHRLGFIPEGLLRSAAKNGDDIVISGMLKTECKWITHG